MDSFKINIDAETQEFCLKIPFNSIQDLLQEDKTITIPPDTLKQAYYFQHKAEDKENFSLNAGVQYKYEEEYDQEFWDDYHNNHSVEERKSPSSQKRAPSTKVVKKPSPVKKNLKTQQKKPSVKTTTPRKRKVLDEIKVSNSRNKSLFPWIETFPYFLDDQTENKRCWFVCQEHAEKYIRRYNPKYKLYCYTGKED